MAWRQAIFDACGGTLNSPETLYYDTTYSDLWATRKSTSSSYRVYGITPPTRVMYSFTGFWTSQGGTGYKVFHQSGVTLYRPEEDMGDIVLYAGWVRLSYELTLDKQSGSGGTSALYSKADAGGAWYAEWQCETQVSSVTPPTMPGRVFDGYWTETQGSASAQKCINADGSFTNDFALRTLTSDEKLYAHWRTVYTITVAANGGTGGTSEFYYCDDLSAFVGAPQSDDAITSITPPAKSASIFTGCYDTDGTGGVLLVAPDGTLASGWTPSGDATIYARWRTLVTVTLDNGDGSGVSSLTYDSETGEYHLDGAPDPVSTIGLPLLECYGFLGYFSALSGGTQYVDASGGLTAAFLALSPENDFTIYAQWHRVSYKATIYEDSDGDSQYAAFYCDGSNAEFYEDDQLTLPTTTVHGTSRPGHRCVGCYTAADGGGTQVVAPDGTIRCGAFSENVFFYAAWQIKTYTLTFDYRGGSGVASSKTVTWAAAIGTLPGSPTPPPGRVAQFGGWILNGSTITAETVWNVDGDATAYVKWITAFGHVEDFFGLSLSNPNLIPFESDDGTNRPRVVTRHYGKAAGAEQTGPVWRNPYVKYMVVGDMTLSVTLGKAYAKKTGTINGPYVSNGTWYFGNHSGMTETGYMIKEVAVETRSGSFPVVTVSSVANEGSDAINLFAVSVAISARARAQNLLGGVSGGGQLQTVSLRAVCDPVVLTEGAGPCASDVVNGRYELRADTLAANRESAPVAAGGFVATGEPAACGGTEYKRYTLMATKEIT